MKKEDPILIVGAGLAGCNLAFQLYQRNIPFKLFNDHYAQQASDVAAGIMNPFLGRKLSPVYKIKESIKQACKSYEHYEKLLEAELLFPCEIIRIIDNKQELEFIKTRVKEYPELISYHADDLHFRHTMGIASIKQGAWLNTKLFCKRTIEFLGKLNFIIHEPFCYESFDATQPDHYKDEKIKAIIFCEGYKAKDNPWFKDLPFKPSKGEVLKVQFSHNINEIIIKSGFIKPHYDEYRIGATSEWNDLSLQKTENAKSKLTHILEGQKIKDFKITDQQVGIRPNSHDTLPYLGQHRKIKQLHIFNGFGGKGVSLIPYCANF